MEVSTKKSIVSGIHQFQYMPRHLFSSKKNLQKLILVGAYLLLSSTLLALQADDVPVSSTIKNVTVFLSGAQVERTATASFAAGESTLVFSELSRDLQEKSIQLDGKGDFTILSIQPKVNDKKEEVLNETPEVKTLKTNISRVKDKIALQQKLQQIYAKEKELILKNWQLGGSQKGVDINNLKQAADFWRNRLTEIEMLELQRVKDLSEAKKEESELSKKLLKLMPKSQKRFMELLVKVKAKKAGNAQFTLSYFVNQAQWKPAYDVRMEQLNQPLEVTLRATVTQNTKEDWDNVNLTLSTGNPTQNGNKPNLNTQYINFLEYYGYNNQMRGESIDYAADADVMLEEVVVETTAVRAKSMAREAASPIVATVERAVATDYEIEDRYSIKGEKGEQVVLITKQEVAATYQHRVVPKLDKAVYLTASINNWDSYGFMNGPMNLYLEGKYTGESYLNSETTNDTLILSLGRDKSVVVEREKNKDFCEKKRLGSKTKETVGYVFNVRNKKNSSVNLIIEDQIPISQNEAIEVELIEKSKAKYDEATGFLTWNLNLKQGDKKDFDFKYSIKHPSKKRTVVQ